MFLGNHSLVSKPPVFHRANTTTQCLFVIAEVIIYYNTKGSSVYAMSLEASKAVDGVDYVKVFRL